MGQKENWSDSGDLEIMYSGTFAPELYRALADALHLEVRSPGMSDAIRHAWEQVEAQRCVCC